MNSKNMHTEIDALYQRLGLSTVEDFPIKNTLNLGSDWWRSSNNLNMLNNSSTVSLSNEDNV